MLEKLDFKVKKISPTKEMGLANFLCFGFEDGHSAGGE